MPKLRGAEGALAKGARVGVVCKKLGVAKPTSDRWRKETGGLQMDQAKRLTELERENARLEKFLAAVELDKAIARKATREITEPGEAAAVGIVKNVRRTGTQLVRRVPQTSCVPVAIRCDSRLRISNASTEPLMTRKQAGRGQVFGGRLAGVL